MRKDSRYRIQRNTHREMVRKHSSYLFVDRSEHTRRIPAHSVSSMIGRRSWYKDRSYPHKFIKRSQVWGRKA